MSLDWRFASLSDPIRLIDEYKVALTYAIDLIEEDRTGTGPLRGKIQWGFPSRRTQFGVLLHQREQQVSVSGLGGQLGAMWSIGTLVSELADVIHCGVNSNASIIASGSIEMAFDEHRKIGPTHRVVVHSVDGGTLLVDDEACFEIPAFEALTPGPDGISPAERTLLEFILSKI